MGRKTIAGLLAVVLLTTLTFGFTAQQAEASLPDTWSASYELPADGSNDSTSDYVVVRNDTGATGAIEIRAWKDNKTAIVNFTNIKNITVNFTDAGFPWSEFKSFIQGTGGGTLKMVLSSDESHLMNFTFNGVPSWTELYLDSTVFNESNYTYSDGTLTMPNMSMSTHTIEFYYQSVGDSIVDVIYPALQVAFFVALIAAILKGVTKVIDKAKRGF